MQTQTFIRNVRAVTNRIKFEYQISPSEELREEIQKEINTLGSVNFNPTLVCLLDLVEAGSKHGFRVETIKSQILVPEYH